MIEPVVRVVIVNYNGGTFLAEAVRSVLQQTIPYELVVVDNASTDESLASVTGLDNVRIVRSERNLGFGAGVNLGSTGAKTQYLAALNPDAIADPRWLERMTHWMDHDAIGLGTCFIGAADAYYFTGGIWRAWRGAAIASHKPGKRVADWINGCAMLIRRALFEELGGFDEGFFLYSEDVDLSLRAKATGASLGVLAERLVDHEHHGSSATVLGDRKMAIAFASHGRLVAKHVPPAYRPLAFIVQSFLVPAFWSRNLPRTIRLAASFAAGYRQSSLDIIHGAY